jgi:hypothetical protein
MTIIDTTTVSVLFALVALAIVAAVAVTGYALVRTYGRPGFHLPRYAKPALHGRFAH